MWTYNSKTGQLSDPAGKVIATGYSGHGAGLNNPEMEMDADVGPIPRGRYTISAFFNDPAKGPIVARLTPLPGTQVYGRSGFMLHGDNSQGNESASLGCIVMPHDARAAVDASSDNVLQVVAP
jgi:hypothetical protein